LQRPRRPWWCLFRRWRGAAFVMTFVVAGAHTLVLGVPLFLLLRWRGWVNVVTATAGGFVIGMLPDAIWSWPLWYAELKTSAWTGSYGQTMTEGVPTTAGWQQYIDGVLIFGAFGAFAGFVFWLYLWVARG